jgi:hypothetical protein
VSQNENLCRCLKKVQLYTDRLSVKYYLFLLFLVLSLSYQNCSNSSGPGGLASPLDTYKEGDGHSTDTGNGGDSTNGQLIMEQIDNLTAVICRKNNDFNGEKIQDCIDVLSQDLKYYNKITWDHNFTILQDFFDQANAGQLFFTPGHYSDCYMNAYHLDLTNYKPGDDIIEIILDYSTCQKIITIFTP